MGLVQLSTARRGSLANIEHVNQKRKAMTEHMGTTCLQRGATSALSRRLERRACRFAGGLLGS